MKLVDLAVYSLIHCIHETLACTWQTNVDILQNFKKPTGEVIEGCRDVFGGISISCVAYNHTRFPYRTIAEQDTFQYALLRLGRTARLGFMWRNWWSHGVAVVHWV